MDWNELKNDSEAYRRAYCNFMYDINNKEKCKECPENIGLKDYLPCGQQHCWVSAHCNQLRL